MLPFEIKFDPDQAGAYAYQIFMNGELVGAVLADCARDALSLAEIETAGSAEAGSWTIIPVDKALALQMTEVVGPDGPVEFEFWKVASAAGSEGAELPTWIFREEQTSNE